jgi:uncharacterized protein YjiS (DUF1127 family)
MTDYLIVAPAAGVICAWTGCVAAKIVDAWRDWRRMRRLAATRRILESLSDATLRDIGFSRGESGSVASEVVGLVERTRWRLIGSARLPAP